MVLVKILLRRVIFELNKVFKISMLWKGGGEVSSLSKIVLIKIKRILYDLLGELK